MAFRKKVDFVQKERDEVPAIRPVVIYITAAIHPEDASLQTPVHKQFEAQPNLPDGVLQRDGNPHRFCHIEAASDADQFDKQLTEALDAYKEAVFKVIVINAHATKEGILLSDEDEAKVYLTGQHFAEVISTHIHDKHFHAMVFAQYGHIFSSEFYTYVQGNLAKDIQTRLAITSFTTQSSPTAWERVATWGHPHVEVKRDVGHFIRETVEPNSPYKVLDVALKSSQCVVL